MFLLLVTIGTVFWGSQLQAAEVKYGDIITVTTPLSNSRWLTLGSIGVYSTNNFEQNGTQQFCISSPVPTAHANGTVVQTGDEVILTSQGPAYIFQQYQQRPNQSTNSMSNYFEPWHIPTGTILTIKAVNNTSTPLSYKTGPITYGGSVTFEFTDNGTQRYLHEANNPTYATTGIGVRALGETSNLIFFKLRDATRNIPSASAAPVAATNTYTASAQKNSFTDATTKYWSFPSAGSGVLTFTAQSANGTTLADVQLLFTDGQGSNPFWIANAGWPNGDTSGALTGTPPGGILVGTVSNTIFASPTQAINFRITFDTRDQNNKFYKIEIQESGSASFRPFWLITNGTIPTNWAGKTIITTTASIPAGAQRVAFSSYDRVINYTNIATAALPAPTPQQQLDQANTDVQPLITAFTNAATKTARQAAITTAGNPDSITKLTRLNTAYLAVAGNTGPKAPNSLVLDLAIANANLLIQNEDLLAATNTNRQSLINSTASKISTFQTINDQLKNGTTTAEIAARTTAGSLYNPNYLQQSSVSTLNSTLARAQQDQDTYTEASSLYNTLYRKSTDLAGYASTLSQANDSNRQTLIAEALNKINDFKAANNALTGKSEAIKTLINNWSPSLYNPDYMLASNVRPLMVGIQTQANNAIQPLITALNNATTIEARTTALTAATNNDVNDKITTLNNVFQALNSSATGDAPKVKELNLAIANARVLNLKDKIATTATSAAGLTEANAFVAGSTTLKTSDDLINNLNTAHLAIAGNTGDHPSVTLLRSAITTAQGLVNTGLIQALTDADSAVRRLTTELALPTSITTLNTAVTDADSAKTALTGATDATRSAKLADALTKQTALTNATTSDATTALTMLSTKLSTGNASTANVTALKNTLTAANTAATGLPGAITTAVADAAALDIARQAAQDAVTNLTTARTSQLSTDLGAAITAAQQLQPATPPASTGNTQGNAGAGTGQSGSTQVGTSNTGTVQGRTTQNGAVQAGTGGTQVDTVQSRTDNTQSNAGAAQDSNSQAGSGTVLGNTGAVQGGSTQAGSGTVQTNNTGTIQTGNTGIASQPPTQGNNADNGATRNTVTALSPAAQTLVTNLQNADKAVKDLTDQLTNPSTTATALTAAQNATTGYLALNTNLANAIKSMQGTPARAAAFGRPAVAAIPATADQLAAQAAAGAAYSATLPHPDATALVTAFNNATNNNTLVGKLLAASKAVTDYTTTLNNAKDKTKKKDATKKAAPLNTALQAANNALTGNPAAIALAGAKYSPAAIHPDAALLNTAVNKKK